MFFSEGVNKFNLDLIAKSAFIVYLSSEYCKLVNKLFLIIKIQDTAENLTKYGKNLMHGNGSNIWFDKSINIIVFKNGKVV